MHKRVRRMLVVIFMVMVCAGTAGAQATRTWVSGVGDDVNPCSRTAPCKTFAGAISKTASGGEINVLDPGGFGAVTITKAITIEGGGFIAGVLVSGTDGIIVNAAAGDTVILRNLDINGTGAGTNGIRFLAGKSLIVENSTIYGFAQYGIYFIPSAASSLSVDRTMIRSTGGGLYVKPGAVGSAAVSVSNSRFEQNQFGVRGEDGSKILVSNSLIGGNAGNGIVSASTTRQVFIKVEGSVLSNNGYGGVMAGGADSTIHLSNDTITGNVVGIVSSTGDVISFGNNRIFANTTDGAPTAFLPLQ